MTDKTLYPNKPSTDLGQEAPEMVLGQFSGNHTGALMWGDRRTREAYTKLYGYTTTIKMLDTMLRKNKEPKTEREKVWYEDTKAYHDELLALQGS